MIERSSEPMVASTIACVLPLGKTITMVSGSVPCSILRLRGVDASGEADGDAMGFVDVCARGAAGSAELSRELSRSTAGMSGMLTKST
jgi:hypothetical protein